MTKKKKLVLFTLLLLVLAIGFTGVTYAYYIDTHGIINKFAPGESDITIEENFPKPDGPLNPEETYTKEVRILNNKNESWVRMLVLVNDSELEDKITINYNTNRDWIKHTDGYWYYTKPVKQNERTSNLIESVTIHESIPANKLEIICYGESVQTEGYKSGASPYFRAFEAIK